MLGAGITEIGGEVSTLTLDEPSAGAAEEVVIDVRAAGVGNWDELARVGSWRIGGPPPMALGVEAAGTIADSTPADLVADSSDRRAPRPGDAHARGRGRPSARGCGKGPRGRRFGTHVRGGRDLAGELRAPLRTGRIRLAESETLCRRYDNRRILQTEEAVHVP
jgi:hypothetical protein